MVFAASSSTNSDQDNQLSDSTQHDKNPNNEH